MRRPARARAPPSRRPPADRPAIDREQAEALHGEIDRLPGPSACRWCSATSRASRSTRPRGGCAARPGRSAAGWPGHERSSSAHSARSRGGPVLSRALAAALAPRSASASVSSPPVRFHDPGRDPLRGPSPAAGAGLSAPAAALAQEVLRYHVAPQAQAHRDVLARPGRRRRGVPEPPGGTPVLAGQGARPTPGVARSLSREVKAPENGRWRRR